jgi:uncharacterized protein YbjT (DUF2867 family)
MRVMVVGATGLIGSAVTARLAREGHEVVAVARRPEGAGATAASRTLVVDVAKAVGPGDWTPHLAGMDAVVNCAGVMQDSPRESVQGVHVSGVAALFEACERAGLRRVIHFSAIGVDRGAVSEFSRSKFEGDRALMARDLDWVILRPAVVLGRGAFGASALFRGLASLPILPQMPDTGRLQVVQLDEVVETVAFFLQPSAPSRLALELAGPEQLTMDEVVGRYRDWLGWGRSWRLNLPGWLSRLLYRMGDFASSLGWRPAMRSTVAKEIVRGAVGDPTRWSEVTGIRPQPLALALRSEPASVQERWFAKMFFLKGLIFTIFPLFWLLTGVISLTTGYRAGVELMQLGGAGALSGPSVIAGALADLAIGALILYRPTTRIGLWAALGISVFYTIAGTALLPALWNEPLGPLLKIWPIMTLNLVALAILEER